MDFFESLLSLLGGPKKDERFNKALPQRNRNESPNLRMYEDNTFSGDPTAYANRNPGMTFYEDNSFAFRPRPYQNPIMGAQDPRKQITRGQTPYSPGEGISLPFNRKMR